MTNEQKIKAAQDHFDKAMQLLREVTDNLAKPDGGAKAFDGGGSNPPGPGQPGHP